MTYVEALVQLATDSERETLSRVLELWRVTDQKLKAIAGNIEHEINLSDLDFPSFLRQLAASWAIHPTDVPATFEDYSLVCGNFTLRGSPLAGRVVGCAGRATELVGFCNYVAKQLRKLDPSSPDSSQIQARIRAITSMFLSDLTQGESLLRNLLRDLHGFGIQTLSGMPTWCTFINPSRRVEPFEPPIHTSRTITNALGLDPKWSGSELIIFVYEPSAYILNKPTVADASAHPFFTPAARNDEHGWTTPHDASRPGITRQPEAVHLPLRITEPISKLLLSIA